MAKKKQSKPKKKVAKKAKKSAPVKDDKLPENYNRRYLIDQLIDKVAEPGIAGISAAKEIRSMLKEEQPDIDLEIHAHWVPIIYDDENFVALTAEVTTI